MLPVLVSTLGGLACQVWVLVCYNGEPAQPTYLILLAVLQQEVVLTQC